MATRVHAPPRRRIGRLSVYFHHGQWYVYFREQGKPKRMPVGPAQAEAEAAASLLNAAFAAREGRVDLQQLIDTWLPQTRPSLAKVIALDELQKKFLAHHEDVLHSARGTITRYRAATTYLLAFAGAKTEAIGFDVDAFVRHLRQGTGADSPVGLGVGEP